MPKKERAEGKADRATSKQAEASTKASKVAEDQFWDDAGEGKTKSKAKAAAKKDDADAAAQKRLETKRMQEAEEAAMSNGKTKAAKASSSVSGAAAANAAAKVTAFQLAQQKEKDAREREADAKERELGAKREITEEGYSKLMDAHENMNKRGDGDEARTLEAALSVLGVKEDMEKHPEKRMRGAWAAYEANNLKELKEDRPGLKLNQYKDMLWKMWQKAPENPMNQAAAAAANR